MSNTLTIVGVMLLAYMIGNISPSTLIAKSRGIDIKKEGSGNAGTTNALRVLGKKAAIATLLIDVGKGMLAVFIAMQLLPYEVAVFSAVAVFFGHIWPVIYGFKGGKGVATAFGASLIVDWRIGLCAAAVFILVVLIFRMVSLGSMLSAFAFFAATAWFAPAFMVGSLIMVVTVLMKHRSNLNRLFRGEENRISFGNGDNKK